MPSYKLSVAGGLASFPLYCAFVDEYMPRANPTFVKVYIYGLRLCYAVGRKPDNASIAAALDILESDVVHAWRYWEKQGIVRLIGEGAAFAVEFEDLTQARPEAAAQKPVYAPSDIAKVIEADERVKSLVNIAQNILGRPLSTTDMQTLFSLYDWLGLPVEVILMLLEYCAGIGKTSFRYIEKVAISWSRDGVDTIEKAQHNLESSEKRAKISRKYAKLLGVGERGLSDGEYAHLLQWTQEMGLSADMIKAAYERTVLNTGKISFPYMNTILKSWHDEGLKKPPEAGERAQKKPPQPARRGNKFLDYKQTGEYNIDEIERLEMAKRIERCGEKT